MNYVILGVFALGVIWFIRRDSARREGVSAATWLPTLWVGILASRPVSLWLGTGGGVDTLEGSPLDRAFYFGMIVTSLAVLAYRRMAWMPFLARNWPIVLFYGYLLVTVLWANSSLVSLKRWTKEVGNIAVVLVILTEVNPLEAIRAVFVRCAYVLIPLSVILIRYFPEIGRRYSQHSGQLEATGVTMQKNSLGAMLLVCTLILVWDWLERSRPGLSRLPWLDRLVYAGVLAAGGWLLFLCDSKTSQVCVVLGAIIVCAIRLPILRRRVNALGSYLLLGLAAFVVLDWLFGISGAVVTSLGRDMTFTGRTDVWRELLAVRTDPIFGTGYMSFWDDMRYRSLLPYWVAHSAHNGYLEVYLAGGLLGVGFLALMLWATSLRINRALGATDSFSVIRFAVLATTLIGNFAESHFACMTPVGFLFLIAAIGKLQPELSTAPELTAASLPRATPVRTSHRNPIPI